MELWCRKDGCLNILPGWHIRYNPKPIPSKKFDYDFWHDEYDYADDTGGNGLAGNAESVDDAINQINDIESSRQ